MFKSIQYMGSKKNLVCFIEEAINQYKKEFNISDNDNQIMADVFCGSGSVAYHFSKKYKMITNDKLAFSKIIMDAYLCNKDSIEFYKPYIEELNNLTISDYDKLLLDNKIDGWLVDKYGGENNDSNENVGENGLRKIWSKDNAKLIEVMLYFIDNRSELDNIQKSVLKLFLFLAINKISNGIGHQNGYLKKWSSKAFDKITIETPVAFTINNKTHFNFCSDVNDFLLNLKEDKIHIAYFDPPYGTDNKNLSVATRYSSFYHLWNTLAASKPFDRPEVFGKANKPTANKGWTEALEKNDKRIVMSAFIRLIENCNSEYIAFSYSNKGLLTSHDMKKVFELAGCDMNTYRLFIKKHRDNSQKIAAKKDGDYITRIQDSELNEYLFIAKKNENHTPIPQGDISIIKNSKNKTIEYIPVVDEYLKNNKEDYSIPKNENCIVIL